ncbi:head-tail connector protein [Jannaschia donghaensis]|uniref:Phage gp6-like head-tail connector protein n=1 Tax=Jannaschia donghaensis TaxID=420998 RepID=A0A0M6YLV3_9RHOB|nr:hypothetical protein [Jannaschia donghaensis]CTQ50910.1 hypothetical protein JDO7802_02941 [Jannaschia donghaensis]
MAMIVQGSDGITEEALPVADLAACLRLMDGYDTVPGQMARLRSRLRAAITMVEGRTGHVLVARDLQLTGAAQGGFREIVPLSPLVAVTRAEVRQGLVSVDLGAATIEPHPHRPTIVFARAVQPGAILSVAVTAGYSAWEQVPAPLREAVLAMAQGLDGAENMTATTEALIAPYRAMRIGGGV